MERCQSCWREAWTMIHEYGVWWDACQTCVSEQARTVLSEDHDRVTDRSNDIEPTIVVAIVIARASIP